MDVFSEARRKIEALKENVNQVIKITFERNKSIIIEYNAKEQMYKLGENSKGSLIKPKYANSTISIKKSKGQPYDRVTLRDTGDFHKSLKVVAYDNYVEVYSDSLKALGLVEKYGDDIFGVRDDLMREFVEVYILPKIEQMTKKTII